MIVGLGADKYGFELKTELLRRLSDLASFRDFGVHSSRDECAYPETGFKVGRAVAEGKIERAILICGTGLGMAISANKVRGVRAAVAYDAYSVERSVLSNNCQVLALGARVVGEELAVRIARDWLQLRFDWSSPSAAKIRVLNQYEAGQQDDLCL